MFTATTIYLIILVLQEAGPSQQSMEAGGQTRDDEYLIDGRIQSQHSTDDIVAAGGLSYVAVAEETPSKGA